MKATSRRQVEHGTLTRYVKYRCRCELCIKASAVYRMQKTAEFTECRVLNAYGRLVSTHPNVRHGTVVGYEYYRCRCDPCTDIAVDRGRQRKERWFTE